MADTEDPILACPECGGPGVYPRTTKVPTYRCRDCGATFAEPTERPGHPPTSGTSAATRTAAIRRAAATLGEPLSVTAYDDWQRDHEEAPSGLYISQYSGWVEACRAAGVTPTQHYAHDADALFAVLARIRDDPGEWPSRAQYIAAREPTESSETWFDDDETPATWAGLLAAARTRADKGEA